MRGVHLTLRSSYLIYSSMQVFMEKIGGGEEEERKKLLDSALTEPALGSRKAAGIYKEAMRI